MCQISTDDVLRALTTWKRRDFKYGDSDCCSFIAHIAKELSGRDYSEYLTYNTEAEAYGIIEAHGSFESLIDSVFGEPCDPDQGSPCMVDIPISGKLMGIKYQDKVVCVTNKGLAQIPDRYIIRGWSLCHR
jgi:hypothetical protein